MDELENKQKEVFLAVTLGGSSLPEGFTMELSGLRSYPDELQNTCNPAGVLAHEASQNRYLGPDIPNELTIPRLLSKRRQAPGFRELKTPRACKAL